jgi:hypothetical protein
MYDRAIKGLNPEERKKLKSLLIEYQDVFAKYDLDLGCLTTVKHNIDTKDATPVKQKMRRIPPAIINSTVIHTPSDCTVFLSDQDWS